MLLAVVMIADGAVAAVGYATRPTSPYQPDARQVAAAQTLVSSLTLPAGATFDEYNTTCGIPVAVCITSATRTPEALFTDVIAALKARGASVELLKCPLPAGDVALGRCAADLRFHGVHLAVSAHDTTFSGSVTTPAWLAVLVDADGPVIGPTTAKPLGNWQALKVMPKGWRGEPACLKPVPRGCNEYRAKLTEPGTPAQAQALLRSSLTSAGYRVDSARCYPAAGKFKGNCWLAASRFRALGGRDEVLVVAVAGADGSNTAVRLDASTVNI